MLSTAQPAELQLWGYSCHHTVPVCLQRAQKDTVSAATDTLGLLFFELLFLVSTGPAHSLSMNASSLHGRPTGMFDGSALQGLFPLPAIVIGYRGLGWPSNIPEELVACLHEELWSACRALASCLQPLETLLQLC